VNGAAPSLALLAQALDVPGLAVTESLRAHRWRGPIASPDALAVHPAWSHRVARLQVLRRALDHRPDGRHALRVDRDPSTGLVGPFARDLPPSVDASQCIDTWPYARVLRRLFLQIDGQRVDADLPERFPGARNDPTLDPAPRLPALLAQALVGVPIPNDAADALRIAIDVHRALIARHVRRRRRLLALLDPGLVPPLQAPGDADAPAAHLRPGEHDDGAAVARPADDGRRSRKASSRTADQDPGGSEAPSTDANPVEESPAPDDPPPGVLRPIRKLPAPPLQAARTAQHDEWDYRQRAYRRRWVTVHEQRLESRDPGYLADLRARFPAVSRRIGRGLARLRPDAPRRERRLPDGETIDLDAAVEAIVARRTGRHDATERAYQSRPRHERDLAIALLVDMSGSTGHRLPEKRSSSMPGDAEDEPLWLTRPRARWTPAAPQRRIIDVARDAVGLLCDAMHALGDRHAVFAFSGQGREHVEFAIVKPFDEAWSARTAAALAAVQPRGYTRTGAAVRHALAHLRTERARRKILIVVSDGYPQDDDYGPRDDTLEYALQDTAHALREAERAGVSTFNISIDSGDTDYLKRMCPRSHYWVVSDVESLPERMQSAYRLLARGAPG